MAVLKEFKMIATNWFYDITVNLAPVVVFDYSLFSGVLYIHNDRSETATTACWHRKRMYLSLVLYSQKSRGSRKKRMLHDRSPTPQAVSQSSAAAYFASPGR